MIRIEIPDEVLSDCCKQINKLRMINEPLDSTDWQEITKLNRERADVWAGLAGVLIGLLDRAGLVEPFDCE